MVHATLIDLPLDLIINILSGWVDLRSLVRLDSACCHVETLTSAFASPAFVLYENYKEDNNDNSKDSGESLEWFVCKSVRSSYIVASPRCNLTEYSKYILNCGKYRYCGITDPTYTSVAALHCSTLTALELDNYSFRAFVKDIIHLAVEHNPLSAPIVRMCSNLTHLNLLDCDQLPSLALVAIMKRCANLRTLGLHNCAMLTDATLIKIGQLCPHIINLDISNCRLLTDAGLNGALVQLKELRILNCMGCNVTDSLLITIASKLAGTITALYISGCAQLTANYINVVVQFCSLLTTLSIDLCDQSSLQVVSLDWRRFSRITTLYVSCIHLSDRALVPIAQHCRSLQHLLVSFATTACVEGPQEVLLQCQQLRTLVIGVEYSMIVPIWQAIRPDVLITYDKRKLQYNPYSM